MMNKVIVGGILVAVMGGVPGATYLLTREETTTKPESAAGKNKEQKIEEEEGADAPCVPDTDSCPREETRAVSEVKPVL